MPSIFRFFIHIEQFISRKNTGIVEYIVGFKGYVKNPNIVSLTHIIFGIDEATVWNINDLKAGI
jgi:hypothetical protein